MQQAVIQDMAFALDGGSLAVLLVDAQGQSLQVLFDRAVGSQTSGRLYEYVSDDTRALLKRGGPRETFLISQLERAASSYPHEEWREMLTDYIRALRNISPINADS